MRCPRSVCGGETSIAQSMAPSRETFPKRLAGRNIQRRQHRCKDCGFKFWTIEMTEAELTELELGIPKKKAPPLAKDVE